MFFISFCNPCTLARNNGRYNAQLQVNLEYLGRVVFNRGGLLYPDSVVGTDSHTTMIDGLGVAGWGVGGIEAEAAMLGQVTDCLISMIALLVFIISLISFLYFSLRQAMHVCVSG